MNNRLTLSSLSLFLPLLLGIAIWLTGCGGGASVPDAVYTAEDMRVPSVVLTDLILAGDPVMVGIGSVYKINWEPINTPPGATVKMYLSESGDFDKNSIEITPQGGVAATNKSYSYSPIAGQGKTGIDYTLIARLWANNYLFDTAKSVRKIRIGEGGLVITSPTTALDLAKGLPINVTWEVTNDICVTLVDQTKIVKLYIDTLPEYKDGRSIEVTPTDGIDACLGQFELLTGQVPNLQLDTTYYIIARLFIEKIEHARAVAPGTFSTTSSLKVTDPNSDIQDNFSSILVSWEVLGREATGLKIEVLAQLPGVTNDVERIISPEYDATLGAATADGSMLPAQTFNVVVRLFTRDELGNKVILDTATANGKIIRPKGYLGTYDLAAMAAATTKNYSPLDGTIFEGFNIGDQAGYELAGLGDLTKSGFSDFMIFARYGQEYSVGNAGSAYLIYGQKTFPAVVNLNSISSPTAATRAVEGTVLMLPMENLASFDGATIHGGFQTLGIPDITGDGKGDLLLGCPNAAPLSIEFTNMTTGKIKGPVKVELDQYELERTYPKDTTFVEPMHVYPWFKLKLRMDKWKTDEAGAITGNEEYYTDELFNYLFGFDYQPGDKLTIEFYTETIGDKERIQSRDSWSHTGERGALYMLPGDRMIEYRNWMYDMVLIGSPVQDGASDTPQAIPENSGTINGDYLFYTDPLFYPDARSRMMTPYRTGYSYGTSISVMPDTDRSNVPQLLVGAPAATVYNVAFPNDPPRPKAGLIKLFDAEGAWTSIPTNVGRIGWADMTSQGLSGPPYAASGDTYSVEIIGPSTGAMLGNPAGLGHFTSLTDYGSYTGGDFNGDNVPDFVAGTPGLNSGLGAIYVIPVRPIFGRRATVVDLKNFNAAQPPGTDPNLEVPVVGIKVLGTDPGMRLGEIVKPAGDFNSDNLGDVMFAMPNYTSGAGRVILMFGKANFYGDFTVDQLDSHMGAQLPALILNGEAAGDHLGQKLCCVYDVNGDGIDDILISAPDAGVTGKAGCGKIYLLYGKKGIVKQDPVTKYSFVDYDGDGKPDDYWSMGDIGNRIPGCVFVGEAAGDHLQTISQAGDANGDGVGDFILGAPFANVSTIQQKAGKAYLIFGRKYLVP